MQVNDPSSRPSTLGQVLVALVFVLQAAVAGHALLRRDSQRFAWQMFSRVPNGFGLAVVMPDGSTLGAERHLGKRGDLEMNAEFLACLCRVSGAAAVEYGVSQEWKLTVETYPCSEADGQV